MYAIVEIAGHQYKVENSTIINLEEGNSFFHNNDDKLILVTCYPFDTVISETPFRYLVIAKKI